MENIGNQINDMLNAAPAAQNAGATPAGEELFLGLTLWGLVFAFAFSLIGMAYIVYAKKQSKLIIGLCGACLVSYTYFVTNTYLIFLIGMLLTLLPHILKRLNIQI